MTTKEVIAATKWLCLLQHYFADQSKKHLHKFNDRGVTNHQKEMYQLICEQYRFQVTRVDECFELLDTVGDNMPLATFTNQANNILFNNWQR